MPDEAAKKVEEAIKEVESEQGSLAELGDVAPPENFGHGSAKSAGVAGNLTPGGGD